MRQKYVPTGNMVLPFKVCKVALNIFCHSFQYLYKVPEIQMQLWTQTGKVENL